MPVVPVRELNDWEKRQQAILKRRALKIKIFATPKHQQGKKHKRGGQE